ncbi:twin-arginine translocation signal domain-containing protein [Streptomyces sp. NPDC017936]|uniref:twin-arginine translocation signal domain-containing protein n=1 Tax=Streptomyces sp. NPDC017936 TaxID=3365016 RepID=UPI0037B3B046
MDTTRRALLKGMAAAPLAATAGGLLMPSTAHAAPETEFVLKRVDRVGSPLQSSWPDAIDSLSARLPDVELARHVLAGARSRGARVTDWHAAKPDHLDYGFAWDPATRDGTTASWYPQGMTTSYDAYGGRLPGSGEKVAVVSWYARGGNARKGARVTFIDVTGDPRRPKYRHVLLVEPVKAQGRRAGFVPVKFHAGGIAWYGTWLYVANTRYGLSVFDTSRMFQVSSGDWCGYDASRRRYAAYGHRYVLPMHHIYENAGDGLTFSQVALDRTPGFVPSLVVSEYRGASPDGRAVRWGLDATGEIADVRTKTHWTLQKARVQGAVTVGSSTAYYSANRGEADGPRRQGDLWTQSPLGHPMGDTPAARLSLGPEDLSYDVHSGGSLWSLGEHAGRRSVYRVTVRPEV